MYGPTMRVCCSTTEEYLSPDSLDVLLWSGVTRDAVYPARGLQHRDVQIIDIQKAAQHRRHGGQRTQGSHILSPPPPRYSSRDDG
jgi:hypothetical protein